MEKSRLNSFGSSMKLLDSIILSTLLYSAPIWANEKNKILDQIQNNYLRRVGSELTAILQALKLVEKNETKNIIIYTDSKAAIFTIKNCYYSQDRLLKNIAADINKLIKNTKISLQWIPSHVGVPGNEEADRLAKEGAAGHPDVRDLPFSKGSY
ncbi:hypothetical protein LAZ67_7000076 [Cordylochernes scorpioides]|uniref:RNase H type-1 domain-containing protein n=1 Tax=Cordylochernes scorpioides TaxID=51811 RepID=A0ABY6KL96_9ARAC|nr:hypothetical protein LAZ67_7000076 [Cordylochernes scorpioides]